MSRKTKLLLLFSMLAVGLLPGNALAADKAQKNLLESTLVPGQSAAVIEFNKAYNLPFDSLTTQGVRIERARSVPDPVALASIAAEMAAVETVSGKRATLTSEALLKEAVDLAKMRSASAELRVIALLVKDQGLAKELDQLATKAKQQEDEDTKAFKAGERPRGIMGTLIVQNGTGDWIEIFANGNFLGPVAPYRDRGFFVGHPPGVNTVLHVRGPNGKHGSRVIFDNQPNHVWNITEGP